MKKIFLFSTILLMLVACSKDKYGSKITLTFLSSTTTNSGINLKYKILYQGGNLNDSINLIKKVLNIKRPKTLPVVQFLLPTLPATSGDMKAEIEIKLDFTRDIGDPPAGQFNNDTIIYSAFIADKQNNISDTVDSDQLIIYKR